MLLHQILELMLTKEWQLLSFISYYLVQHNFINWAEQMFLVDKII